MVHASKPKTSVAEFLAWNDGTDRRHDLVDGEIVAMAPPSAVHGRIAANLAALIRAALSPPCGVHVEAGIYVNEHSYYQADLAVTCTKLDPKVHWVPNPILIVEILSPSTEDRDSHVKTPFYRGLDSVKEILVLHSDCMRAEIQRRGSGGWTIEDVVGAKAGLRLDSIAADVRLSDIFDGIELAER
jgi:Uma2 family endonuclease